MPVKNHEAGLNTLHLNLKNGWMFGLLFVTTICHFLIVPEVLQVRMNINLKSLSMPNQCIGCDNCGESWFLASITCHLLSSIIVSVFCPTPKLHLYSLSSTSFFRLNLQPRSHHLILRTPMLHVLHGVFCRTIENVVLPCSRSTFYM